MTKKQGYKDLMKGAGSAALLDSSDQTPSRSKRQVGAVQSASAISSRPKAQSYTLRLPVSGKEVRCIGRDFNAAELGVAWFNKRYQALLDENAPAIKELRERILAEGQNDPILVRDGEDGQPEVVYGSRRRFVVASLNKKEWSDNPAPIKAWYFADISDEDAKRLAESENEDKDPISTWEKAQFIKLILDRSPGMKKEDVAREEGVSPGTVSKYLALADLPIELVRLVKNASDLSVNSAIGIQKLLKGLTKSALSDLYAGLGNKNSYEDGDALRKAIQSQLKPKAKKKPAQKKDPIELPDSNGKVRAQISAHRTKKGHYSVKFFDVDDEVMAEVEKTIKKLIK